MSAYTQALDWCERHGGGYRVTRALSWEVGRPGSGLQVTVPPGFGFEVSVPRWLRWAANPHRPEDFKAADLHDFTLESGWDRISGGALFHAGLKVDGVGRLRRLAMTLAVMLYRFQ